MISVPDENLVSKLNSGGEVDRCIKTLIVMIKHIPLIAAMSVILFVLGTPFQIYGQDKKPATRIRFRRGETATTIKGELSSKRLGRAFVLSAQVGQELHVKITEDQRANERRLGLRRRFDLRSF
jgi:hypothetical protein